MKREEKTASVRNTGVLQTATTPTAAWMLITLEATSGSACWKLEGLAIFLWSELHLQYISVENLILLSLWIHRVPRTAT